MGQGYTRNDTANNIADGNVIDAVDLDGEFDAIVAAFESATGHTHDGTSAEGAPINVMGPAQEFLVDGTAIYPKTNNTYDLGKSAALIRALYATTAIVSVAQVTTLKANDGTAAGSIADSTGVVTLASAVLTTADINGGTLDGVTIGATTPAAGSFTNVNVTGTVDGRDVATDGTKLDTVETNADVTDTTNVTAAGALMDSELASVAAVKATTGTFLTADQSKLDGIEALADVTDAANVTAAGALMDSELTSIGSVKGLDQGVATTDSPSFAAVTAVDLDLTGQAAIDNTTNSTGALTVTNSGTNAWGVEIGQHDIATESDLVFTSNATIGVGLNLALALGATNSFKIFGGATDKRTGIAGATEVFSIAGDTGETIVGKTVDNTGTDGHVLRSTGQARHSSSASVTLQLNRNTNNGDIIQFRKADSTVGTISVTGSATAYNTSSDYRLKENIAPIQGAADIVKVMKPCTYTFKSDGSWHDGFLAHELQEIHPRAVVGEKDAVDEDGTPIYQGVDYSKLTPILTAALQEALNKIDALEDRITAMENK